MSRSQHRRVLTSRFLGFIVKLRHARRQVSHHCDYIDDKMHTTNRRRRCNDTHQRTENMFSKFGKQIQSRVRDLLSGIFIFRKLSLGATNSVCVCRSKKIYLTPNVRPPSGASLLYSAKDALGTRHIVYQISHCTFLQFKYV